MKLQATIILLGAATGFSLGVAEIPAEAFSGAGVGLGTIALWQFARLVNKADKALDCIPTMAEHLQSIDAKQAQRCEGCERRCETLDRIARLLEQRGGAA